MPKMTSRERLITALNCKEPDMVPIHEFLMSRTLFQEVLGYTPENYDAESVCRLAMEIGYDSTLIPFIGVTSWHPFKIKKGKEEGVYTDDWGTVHKKDASTWPADAPIGYPISNREDLKNYIWPDPLVESRLDDIKVARRMLDEKNMALIGIIRGPFSSAWMLAGMDKFLMNFYADPELNNELMSKCTDFYITGAQRMAEAGADAIFIADDYAYKTSSMMSPQQFTQYILPHLKRMVEAIRKTKALPILHSDGHIQNLLDPIINEVPIAALNPIERAAGMDIAEVKKKYGQKIAIIGNVNQQTTLITGTKEEVVEETKECIKIAAPGGGYVLASDHSVHDDIPNENIFAMYEAGRKFGSYPINITD